MPYSQLRRFTVLCLINLLSSLILVCDGWSETLKARDLQRVVLMAAGRTRDVEVRNAVGSLVKNGFWAGEFHKALLSVIDPSAARALRKPLTLAELEQQDKMLMSCEKEALPAENARDLPELPAMDPHMPEVRSLQILILAAAQDVVGDETCGYVDALVKNGFTYLQLCPALLSALDPAWARALRKPPSAEAIRKAKMATLRADLYSHRYDHVYRREDDPADP